MNQPKLSIVDQPEFRPPHLDTAFVLSARWHEEYINTHSFTAACLSPETATVLGLSRLQWLIANGREEIASLFTMAEFFSLLECFDRAEFSPNDLGELDVMLIDHLDGQHTELVTKLSELRPGQRVVLVDLLEQVVHYGQSTSSPPAQVLKFLGVSLS